MSRWPEFGYPDLRLKPQNGALAGMLHAVNERGGECRVPGKLARRGYRTRKVGSQWSVGDSSLQAMLDALGGVRSKCGSYTRPGSTLDDIDASGDYCRMTEAWLVAQLGENPFAAAGVGDLLLRRRCDRGALEALYRALNLMFLIAGSLRLDGDRCAAWWRKSGDQGSRAAAEAAIAAAEWKTSFAWVDDILLVGYDSVRCSRAGEFLYSVAQGFSSVSFLADMPIGIPATTAHLEARFELFANEKYYTFAAPPGWAKGLNAISGSYEVAGALIHPDDVVGWTQDGCPLPPWPDEEPGPGLSVGVELRCELTRKSFVADFSINGGFEFLDKDNEDKGEQ